MFDPKDLQQRRERWGPAIVYEKGQTILAQGAVADAVFYIQQGNVKLTVVSEQGKEAVVAILGPGIFLVKDV